MTDTPAAAASPGGSQQPAMGYAWFVVGALSLVNMVSYVERQMLTLLFAPIKRDFNLTDTQVSLLAGAAFVLFFVVFGLYFGRLADRSNRKRIILVGALFWGLATAACGMAQNFVQLFIARISVGIGESTLGSSALSIITDTVPRNRLTRAISIYTGSQYAGAGLALVVGALAINVVAALPPLVLPGLGAMRPWQTTFLLVGLFGLLFCVPALFIKEPTRKGLAKTADATLTGLTRPTFWAFFSRNRRMLICHFAAFSLSSMLGFGIAAWMPSFFIRVHGWQAQDIGYVYGTITAVMGVLGALTGGRIAEYFQERGRDDIYFVMPMVTVSTNMVLLVAAMFAPSAIVALALLTLGTFVQTLPLSLIGASLQAVAPNELRGQLAAAFGLVANIVGVASGPTVIALLTDYVYRDELAVGRSLATASMIIVPLVVVILAIGRSGLKHSLARADAFTPGPTAAA